jgi:hypothetical protein
MYVIAQHTILDSQQAMQRGQPLFTPPPGITLHYFLPNMGTTKAICLWEADSVETIQQLVDSTLGDSAKNECYQVDTKNAWGLSTAPLTERAVER